MAKLTKTQAREISAILRHARRALHFIEDERTVVATRETAATTTLDYLWEREGAAIAEIEKSYGSDLTGLYEAVRLLDRFLFNNLPR